MFLRIFNFLKVIPILLFFLTFFLVIQMSSTHSNSSYSLLSDPFLQFPTTSSVKVVWFTEFSGIDHKILYGQNLDKVVKANTTQLSCTREDQDSKVTEDYSQTTKRNIWRHEGEVTGLNQGKKYLIRSLVLLKISNLKVKLFL